jgi:hypothetical protein
VSAAVHYCDYVIYGVCWVAAVVARGVALQNYGSVAFVFWVAVFFTHCYRAASGLLSFAVVDVSCRANPLCRFVKCMSSVCVITDKVMMLYPSGCLNPITLHI